MKRLNYSFIESIWTTKNCSDIKDLQTYHLKENLFYASMALIQCPYDCKVNIRKSLAGWYVFIDFVNKDRKKVVYLVSNLELPKGVYNKFCDAIGI